MPAPVVALALAQAVLEVVATVRADQGVPAAPLTDRKKSAMV